MKHSVRLASISEPGRFRIENASKESREALLAEIIRLRAYVKQMEQAADADVLAPVYNRRAFLRELVKAQSIYQRHKIPTSMILMNLDGFKTINQRYGHVIGDELIVRVGDSLQRSIRDCDMVARLGSDDFAVLLFKCKLPEAQIKARRLTDVLGAIGIDMPSNSLYISASYGLTKVENGMTPERIMNNAHEQMSRNKRLKNRDKTMRAQAIISGVS